MSRIRLVCIRTALLLIGNITTVIALSELNLDCTNDFDETLYCQLDTTNCTEYNLTVSSDLWKKKWDCRLQQCGDAQCCCSVKTILILGDHHTAVLERGNSSKSKTFDVKKSMKPKTPIILSVNESNGNFEVFYDTKMEGMVEDTLMTEVTYFTKGDIKTTITIDKLTTVNGLSYYKIPGQELEPNKTYTVRVRSKTKWNNKTSDSSNEMAFKTQFNFPAASSESPFLAIIISLSVVAVVLSSVIYLCFVKAKTKCWDNPIKHLKPTLDIVPSRKQLLKPVPAIISSISIDDPNSDDGKSWSKTSDNSGDSLLQSSGISSGSSGLTYASAEPVNIIAGVQDALCKAFPNIAPISQLTTPLIAETDSDRESENSGFINRTYSIILPSIPQQNILDGSEVYNPAERLCDPQYRSIHAEVVENHHRQPLACPLPPLQDLLADSSFIPTDMSYQQCQADPGRCTEDLFPASGNAAMSSELMSGVETGSESCEEAISTAPKMNSTCKDDLFSEENPCYGSTPAGSQSVPLVEDDYQAFQSLVGHPDVLPSDETTTDAHSDKQEGETFIEIPQNLPNSITPLFTTHSQTDQNELISFLSVEPSMSVITESGYQCV